MRLLLLLTFSSTVLGAVHEVFWDITYVENVNPDGLAQRRAIGVNGTWPPPPIEVTTNDTLVVHATNTLDQPTSLHHHGMFFNSTSWMDGAVGVSECGIPPKTTFDYVVPVNESGQWGSYWVHAHASGQYVDGLRAPLIIHPTKEVYQYDEEFTVVLGDWYHTEHSALLKEFISIKNPGGAEPVPDSALIYFSSKGSYLPPSSGTASVGFNDDTSLPFQPGKTYRLRVINTSAFAMFFFWIDGHQMRIIEVDGTDVEESPVDMLSVTVAQRYSVLVTARNDSTPSNWAIHANMDTDMFDTVPDALNPNITSSITYTPNSSSVTNNGTVDSYTMVEDISLVPVQKLRAPEATKTIELEVLFDTMDDGTNRAMFNGVTYNQPKTPAILSALTLGSAAQLQDAYGPSTFVIQYGDVVDLVVKNGDAGKHPFHIHGHKFMLVNRATDYTSSDDTLNPPLSSIPSTSNQLTNPMRRDTVHIESGGSATLRFVADNPGVWFFHCHIEWHLEAGLAIQLVEAPLHDQMLYGNLSSSSAIPQIQDNCKALGRPHQGNAAGHTSDTSNGGDGLGASNLSGWFLGPFQQKLGWRPKGIGAMFGCVLTAVLGMLVVTWYSWDSRGSMDGEEEREAEIEREVRERLDAKEKKSGFMSRITGKS